MGLTFTATCLHLLPERADLGAIAIGAIPQPDDGRTRHLYKAGILVRNMTDKPRLVEVAFMNRVLKLAPLWSAAFLLLAPAACRPRVEPGVAAASHRPRVYTTGYPLFYFAQRLVGDGAEVVFPAPPKDDPVFWRPSKDVVRQFQEADLILLNGADFDKWVTTTSLPLAAQVDTSAAFKNEWLMFPGVVTHSHGPQGMHSHGLIDFTQAALQALSIHDALLQSVPEAKKKKGSTQGMG